MLDSSFQFLADLVRRHTGMVYTRERQSYVEQALRPLLLERGESDVDGFVGRLSRSSDPALAADVVSRLTIGETYFFRDAHVFRYLETDVFPRLLARTDRAPTLWSAACATGQEAYSLAIALAEANGGRPTPLAVLASDVNEQALARAREGLYSDFETSRGLTGFHRARWFRQEESGRWRVRSGIRSMVEFHPLNLCHPTLEPPMQFRLRRPAPCLFDVILLRNVLIYMEPGSRLRVLRRMSSLLAPGGMLLLGAAELLPLGDHMLRIQGNNAVVFARKEGP